MPTEQLPLHPRQERSRATVERLLNATIAILDREGLDGAVIPAIGRAAGMSPANVYRRFADKNALLRAAFLHALAHSKQANREQLGAQVLGDSLVASARKVVALLFTQYRQHPHFLRALSRFIEGDADQDFVREARALIGANLYHLVDVLLAHRDQIAHPAPGAALRFALLSTTCSIEAYALDPQSIWHVAPAISPQDLTDALVRSFVAYLGVAPAA